MIASNELLTDLLAGDVWQPGIGDSEHPDEDPRRIAWLRFPGGEFHVMYDETQGDVRYRVVRTLDGGGIDHARQGVRHVVLPRGVTNDVHFRDLMTALATIYDEDA